MAAHLASTQMVRVQISYPAPNFMLIRTCSSAAVQAIEELRGLLLATHVPFQRMCNDLLDHSKFLTAPGSAGEHHAYEGGLAIHTFEVTYYAGQMAEMFPDCDLDVVLTAAVFHDFMKIHEYEFINIPATKGTCQYTEIEKTPYRNLVRHVAGSHAEFVRRMEKHRHMFSEERYMNIEHTILAHHGRKECGSPIEPQTVEAYILHYADMYSVKFGPGR